MRPLVRAARDADASLLNDKWGWMPLSSAGRNNGLGILDDVTQDVTVVGVAGQSLGVQHELAARGSGVGGDDGDLDAELVRRAGLTLANALGLGAWKEYSFQPRGRCCWSLI